MRKKRNFKKDYRSDAMHDSVALGRFINYVMEDGKRSVAERVVYGALEKLEKENKENPLTVFEQAIENATPSMEVISRRIGGANYQIPMEVRPERKFFLASNWLINAAKAKKGKPMADRLAEEILAASKNEGEAIKKKQNVHRMAEANRAFAHFGRRR